MGARVSKLRVGLVEPVRVYGKNKSKLVLGKFDTGALRTSVDKELVKKIGMERAGVTTTVNTGGRSKRDLTKIKLKIKRRVLTVVANVSDRCRMKHKVLIGRDVMFGNFVVDVSRPKPTREFK